MADILKEFSRKATLAYARARQPRQYVGATLFPRKLVNELTFEYWRDLNLLPVMASVQAFGVEAQVASRDGADKVTGEIPTIKRKIPLSGRHLVALRREGAGDIPMVREQLYNDSDNMINSVDARIEQMCMDALAFGQLTLNENDVIMNVNYGVPNNHRQVLVGNALWSDPVNSTPVTDMQRWSNQLQADGAPKPERVLTSNTVVANLLRCAEVRTLIFGDLGGSRAVSVNQLNDLMGAMDLPRIATYDLQARRQNADGTYTTARFFPANMFVMMPGEKLGDTLDGPTEDAMLDADVDTAEISGIYLAVYKESMDPPVITTKAAACRIPTFPMANAVFQAQVLA